MSSDPEILAAAAEPPAPVSPRRRQMVFAEQEMRLISALVMLIGIGLFLALPFVLSIGSVVFLPLVTAIVLTIVLSPLADRLAGLGLPNALASFAALLVLLAVVALALAVVLSPAMSLFETMPAMVDRIGTHFHHLQGNFSWMSRLNDRIAALAGREHGQRVVVAGPSVLQQLALATPSVILEVLLTLLMSFFMIEARVRLRRHLLLDRTSFGTSLKAARVLRDVQDRVGSYILTVALINVGVGLLVVDSFVRREVKAPVAEAREGRAG